MKTISIIIVAIVLGGCASQPRTKFTDKSMRILIDPDSLPADQHVALQRALWESGKWFIVDRSRGYRAVKAEQERSHRTEGDRYADEQKWAHWGKLFSVGGIVVGSVQCKRKQHWLVGAWHQECKQYLSIVDSNTGEIIVSVDGEDSSDEEEYVPPWDSTVAKLNASYPKDFKPMKTSERIERYKELSREEAQRARERIPTIEGE